MTESIQLSCWEHVLQVLHHPTKKTFFMLLKLSTTKVIYNALQKAIQLFFFQIWQQNIIEVFWQVLLNTIKENKVSQKNNNFCHALQQVTMETIFHA